MSRQRKAFTLIEVLIAIALLSVVLLALYNALSIQRKSNNHLFKYLSDALDGDKAIMVLYRDILYSDGNITVKDGEFDKLFIESTSNSLYGLSSSKVCWIVGKENNKLLRIEGNRYKLPLKYDDKVAVDNTMQGLSLFDIVINKDKILISLRKAKEKPYTFVVYGVEKAKKRKKIKKRKASQDNNETNSSQNSPSGSI